jgi:hypothetical protein
MKNILLAAALVANGLSASAAQIFEFSREVNKLHEFRLYSATPDDVEQATTPFYSQDATIILTEEDAPEFWARIIDGVPERVGIPGFETTEGGFFWGDHNADPADLIGTGVTYLRVVFTPDDERDNIATVTGHDGAVPDSVPDGGATALLLGCGILALVRCRR